MHGGDRKSTDAKPSSLNANLIDSSKTCDRIAEENGVSRASVLRASHYTRGIDITDNRSPGIKQKVLRFAMQRPALDLNELEACWNSEEGQRSLVGARPLHLLLQDRSVAQKPHCGFCCCANASLPWQAEQAHHANNEKQEVPVGELPAVHIAIVCGFWQGASYSGAHPVFCFVRSLSFFLTFEIG